MKFIAIIPARYASTRFPGKPLATLAGKPVIQHVYEKVSSVVADTWVATDDDRIFNTVKAFGGKAIMTRTDHKSGTDRIEEAVEKIGGEWDVVINVQGDEPFIHTSQIETVCRCFDDPSTEIATLGKPFGDNIEAISNPNSPKIVIDKRGYPLLKHLGLYAYRRNVLKEVTRLPQGILETAESLEQLRWLENGYRIKVGQTDIETIGIDTPEDLEKAEEYVKGLV